MVCYVGYVTFIYFLSRMIKMNKALSSLLLSCLVAAPAIARPLADEGGWEFSASINAGYTSSQSNLSTDDNQEVITDLNSEAAPHNRFIAYPFARVQYTTEDLKTQFFLGNSRDQIATSQFQYELGVVHQFVNNSQLTVAYFPELPIFNETYSF